MKDHTITGFNPDKFLHRGITDRIIGVFFDVYNELGHGFLESVYQESMRLALNQASLAVQSQCRISVRFRGQTVGDFVADFLVEDAVIVELKAVDSLVSQHEAQLLNYLKATRIEVGLLLNFGPKAEIRRLAFSNSRKDNHKS